jgi:pimeloyl-CoA dehydrogenase small subunit
MDFRLSEEQQLLKDSVQRFLDKNYTFETRRKLIAERQGMSTQAWEGFASLGLLGVPFAAEHGGFGGDGTDVMIVMEALGRALSIEPYLSTVLLAGGAIDLGGAQWQKNILLPRIIDGSLILAFAHSEPGARYDLGHVNTRAVQDGDGWVLEGEKTVVLHGAIAEKYIVSARTSGSTRDSHGVTLFIVDADEEGIGGRDYPTFDGVRAGELSLSGVKVGAGSIIGTLDKAMPLIEQVTDRAIAGLCADAVGAMDALHAATLDYVKTRQQFGVPIGKFQALQHRMVDMLIQLEQARSMALLAAVKAWSDDANERRRACAAAKEYIGRAGRFVGQQAIQLHGGMGMTDELPVSHYFKRLTAIDMLLGDQFHHRARFAQMKENDVVEKLEKPRKMWKQI